MLTNKKNMDILQARENYKIYSEKETRCISTPKKRTYQLGNTVKIGSNLWKEDAQKRQKNPCFKRSIIRVGKNQNNHANESTFTEIKEHQYYINSNKKSNEDYMKQVCSDPVSTDLSKRSKSCIRQNDKKADENPKNLNVYKTKKQIIKNIPDLNKVKFQTNNDFLTNENLHGSNGVKINQEIRNKELNLSSNDLSDKKCYPFNNVDQNNVSIFPQSKNYSQKYNSIEIGNNVEDLEEIHSLIVSMLQMQKRLQNYPLKHNIEEGKFFEVMASQNIEL